VIRNLSTFGNFAFCLGAVLLTPHAATATTLTGAVLMDTDGTGNAGGNYWNTLGQDGGIYNLYLKDGGLGFVNSGAGATTRINIDLLPGSYTFNFFADSVAAGTSFGLNLFFNLNDNAPGISVFGSADSFSFSPNSGSTRELNGITIAGANTATFVDGSTSVFLTGFNIATPVVGVAPDEVDAYNNAANNNPDFAGSFSLRVTGPGPDTQMPEPASMMLLGGGLVGLLAASRRLRRA